MSSNFYGIVCGPRGCGKTSRIYELARDALERGRWVFAHDPQFMFKGLCERYPTTQAWEKAMRTAADGKTPIARGASFTCDIGDLIGRVTRVGGVKVRKPGLLDSLGSRWNNVDAARFPMSLFVDESALLGQGNHVSEALNELLALLRHLGIEAAMNCQRRAQLSVGFWELATDVYLFRQPPGRTEEIEGPLCLGKGTLRGLERLDKYNYVHVVQGEGPSEAP